MIWNFTLTPPPAYDWANRSVILGPRHGEVKSPVFARPNMFAVVVPNR